MPSTGSAGDAHVIAMAESFIAMLERGVLHRRRLGKQAEACMAMFQSDVPVGDGALR
jgi:hypothetical protein